MGSGCELERQGKDWDTGLTQGGGRWEGSNGGGSNGGSDGGGNGIGELQSAEDAVQVTNFP